MKKSNITFEFARSSTCAFKKCPDSATREESVTRTQSEQTLDNHPMLFQCCDSVEGCGSTLKQHLVNAMCLLMCWRKVYSRSSARLVLGQRRR